MGFVGFLERLDLVCMHGAINHIFKMLGDPFTPSRACLGDLIVNRGMIVNLLYKATIR